MLTNCPKCNMEVKQTIESARSHVRFRHSKLSDKAKIRLRDSICRFVPTDGLKTRGRSVLENQLSKQLGIS